MLMHLCRCGAMIPQGVTMCKKCEATRISRHMIYNQQRRSKIAAAFYCTRAWRIIRDRMFDVFDGVDIVAFYEQEKVLEVDHVHHIEELEEAWDKRLEPMNLIPLNHATHTRITLEYKASPERMRACQKRLLEYRDRWFADRGGVEKVFRAAGLVAPPQGYGENSPRENLTTRP